jgi:hypothetical protein
MKKQTTSNRQKQLLFAAIACITLFLAGQTQVAAQNQPRKYQPGYTWSDGSYVYKLLRCDGEGEWSECEVQMYKDNKPGYIWRTTLHNIRAIEQSRLAAEAREAKSAGGTGNTNNNTADQNSLPQQRTTVSPTPPPNRQATQGGAAGGNKTDAECTYEPPGPPVTGQSRFSEAVAKRKTYDWYAVNANGTGFAPVKVGVVFLSFKMGAPYKNTVSIVPGYGAKRRHDGAPPGATIYTPKIKIMVCEQYSNAVERKLVEGTRACFKTKDGSWTCPGADDTKTTKLK